MSVKSNSKILIIAHLWITLIYRICGEVGKEHGIKRYTLQTPLTKKLQIHSFLTLPSFPPWFKKVLFIRKWEGLTRFFSKYCALSFSTPLLRYAETAPFSAS